MDTHLRENNRPPPRNDYYEATKVPLKDVDLSLPESLAHYEH